MGICECSEKKSSNKKNNNLKKYVYSINPKNSIVTTNVAPKGPLKFDCRIFNFQASNLFPNKHYLITVKILEKTFYLKSSSQGPNPIFELDERSIIEIKFEQLKKSYVTIELFCLNKPFSSKNNKKSVEEIVSNKKPISILSVDFLTVVIGTKHHDIQLLSTSETNEILGRMQFDILCEQIEEITISLKKVHVKLDYLVSNLACFRLKFLYERNCNETLFTLPVASKINQKDNKTEYFWKASVEDKDTLKINKVILNVNELFCSNLEIIIYETNFSYEGNSNNKMIQIKNTTSQEEILPNETYFKKIKKKRSNSTFELHSKTTSLIETKFLQNENKNDYLILLPNFNEIGYSRLNLYNLLSEKTFSLKYNVKNYFQKLSYLYSNDTDELNLSGEQLTSKRNFIDLKLDKVKSHKSEINISKRFNQIQTSVSSIKNINTYEKEDLNENNNKNENKKLNHNIVLKLFDDCLEINFKEDVFCNAKKVGEINGILTIENIPLLKQNQIGVHTEKGLDLSSNFYYNSPLTKSNSLPKQIKEIELASINYSQCILDFTLKQNSYSYKELKNNLTLVLKHIKSILLEKDFISKIDYDRIRAAQILINLGINIINSMDGFGKEQRELCFDILILINNRKELTLRSLSLLTNIENNDNNNNNENNLKKNLQINVINSFLEFMNKSLINALNKLTNRFSDEQSTNFISEYLAICYFRIPAFRHCFLKAIFPNYKIDANEMNISYNYVIDWNDLFYSKIKKIKEIKFEEKKKKLIDEINSLHWRERICKKGLGFYSIIARFENYLFSEFDNKEEVSLDHVPGINEIKKSIIDEIEKKPISSISPNLIKLLNIFIYNPNDVNDFFKIIVNRTNGYDTSSVFNLITILDSFFEASIKNKMPSFGYKFDYNLLKSTFTIILEIDNALCIAKLLWFYYKHSHRMSIIHLVEVISEIFQNKFYFLFFHWSWQVREIFHHYLLYIVSYKIKNKNYLKEKKNLIEQRMTTLKKDDEEGFYKTFHNDYYQKLKIQILKLYYEKARIIEMFKSNVKKENLDPTYQTTGGFDPNVYNKLCKNEQDSIVESIIQYEITEKNFKLWEKENKGNEFPVYPVLNVYPPKDDYTEYSSHSYDNW